MARPPSRMDATLPADSADASRVSASRQTKLFTIQLVQTRLPSPCDALLREAVHVIAMQRQRIQVFSTGRFEQAGCPPDWGDIGRVMLLPAGWPLHVRAEGGATESIRCLFSPATLYRLTRQRELIPPADGPAALNLASPVLVAGMARLADELVQPDLASDALIDALGSALVIDLCRYLDRQHRRSGPRRGGLPARALRQLTAHMEARNGAVSLGELASLSHLSERQLTRAFRQSIGMTIAAYAASVRAKHAMLMLAEGEAPVGEIATRLGFSGSGAFCVFFQRQTGETPLGFRRRVAYGAASASNL